MKNYLRACKALLFCTIFVLGNGPAEAQDDLPTSDLYKGVWKYRPLQFGEYYISRETVKERNLTNEIGIGYVYKSFVKAADKDRNTLPGFYSSFIDEEEYAISEANGLLFRMAQKYYKSVKKDAPEGFYYGPVFMYRFIAFEGGLLREFDEEVIGRMYQHVLALHFQVGYQKIFAKRFAFEIFGGLGARAKYAHAKISKGRTEERIIGVYKVGAGDNSAFAAAPALHLNFAVGYVIH